MLHNTYKMRLSFNTNWDKGNITDPRRGGVYICMTFKRGINRPRIDPSFFFFDLFNSHQSLINLWIFLLKTIMKWKHIWICGSITSSLLTITGLLKI